MLGRVLCMHPGKESLAIERASRSRLLALDQGSFKGLQLGFVFFQKAKPCPHYVTGRTIAARLHLRINEAGEVIAKGYGRVAGHCPAFLRNVTNAKYWYH